MFLVHTLPSHLYLAAAAAAAAVVHADLNVHVQRSVASTNYAST